jgi:hypothetical protein
MRPRLVEQNDPDRSGSTGGSLQTQNEYLTPATTPVRPVNLSFEVW